MRIPKFIKALCKFCDTESSRYALGGVLCEHKDSVSTMTATDGKFLASVSYVDVEAEDMEAIVDGKAMAKAVTATDAVKSRSPWLGVSGTTATVQGASGTATAAVVEGRFPRYRDVFEGVGGPYACIKLDPKLMKIIAELYASAATEFNKGVDVWVPHDNTKPTLYCHTTAEGEVIRVVQMPLAADSPSKTVPEFPGPAVCVDDKATPLPEPEDEEPFDGGDDEDAGPLDAAPPPECVDDDTLAPTFADAIPGPAPMPAGF